MKFQNIEAIIFIFILFFLIMWGLPKCRSNSQPAAAAPETVAVTPPQLPQSPPATTGTSTATVAPATSTMSPVTETPPPTNSPTVVARLMPKPMNVRTVQRPAARPAAPVSAAEQTVPFNPTGSNTGEPASESGVKNVWTVTSDVKLRGTPGLDGKLLGKIPKGIQLTYLNIKTDKTQRLTIDGTEQDEPWLKVRTPRGTVGWVYGGVVRFYKK